MVTYVKYKHNTVLITNVLLIGYLGSHISYNILVIKTLFFFGQNMSAS